MGAMESKRAEESAAAAAKAKFLGLPKLKGTEKQVAWAESIRDKFRQYCEACMLEDAFEKVARRAKAKTARFWIDNRTELDFIDLQKSAI